MAASRHRALALLVVAAVAGCDGLSLEPENPRDPLYGEGRVPTGPDAVRLGSATATRVTLEWDDRSSFETAFVVGQSGLFDAVDASGPWVPEAEQTATATTVSMESLDGAGPYYFAVRAEAAGVRSPPSAVLTVVRPFRRAPSPPGRSGTVTASAGRLAALGTDRGVAVVDVPTLTTVALYPDCRPPLAVAADGMIAMVCADVHVYRDGQLLRQIPLSDEPSPPVGLALADDGTALAIAETAYPSDRIRVVRVADGTTAEHLVGRSRAVTSLALRRDGQRIVYAASVEAGSQVRSWTVGTSDVDWTAPIGETGDRATVGFGAGGEVVAVLHPVPGSRDGAALRLLDGATGAEAGRRSFPGRDVLALSASGRTLATRPVTGVGVVTVHAISPAFERVLDVPLFDRAPVTAYGLGDRDLLAYDGEAFAPDGSRGVLYVRDLDAPWQAATE